MPQPCMNRAPQKCNTDSALSLCNSCLPITSRTTLMKVQDNRSATTPLCSVGKHPHRANRCMWQAPLRLQAQALLSLGASLIAPSMTRPPGVKTADHRKT